MGLWYTLFLLSGFLAVALEIVWFRYFATLTYSSAYTFGHVLGVFLLFDGLGLVLGAQVLAATRAPARLFLPLQGAIVFAAVAMFILVGHPALAPLGQFSPTERSPLTFALVFGAVPLLTIAPAATLIGMSFPLVQRALQTAEGAVGWRVGGAQVANIVGNTLGGLVTGLFLLHAFGTLGTLRILAGVGGLGALFAAVGPGAWRFQGWSRGAVVGLAGATWGAALLLPEPVAFWPTVMNMDRHNRFEVREDRTGVSVLMDDGHEILMFANGVGQGHVPFRSIHFILGIVGPLLHPNPEDVFVIGIGSGGTPSGAAALPETRRVRAVEIVAAGMPMLETFARGPRGDPVRPLFDDPRFSLAIDDGRRELAIRSERFDVIEADAIMPQGARSGMLYSQEFYALVRRRLKDGGIMIQWAASPRVRATFRHSFPFGYENRLFLAGSDRPIERDRARMDRRLADPRVRAWLEAGGVEMDRVRSAVLSGSTWSPGHVPPPDPNHLLTDLFPRDEFYLSNP